MCSINLYKQKSPAAAGLNLKVIIVKNKQRFNGEGSFYFDKAKNRWYGVLTLGYKDDKPIRKKVSDKTFKGAQKKFNELKEQVLKGELAEKDNSLLKDVISSLIERNKALNLVKDSTYRRELHTLKIIESSPLGKMSVQSIRECDILIFLNNNLYRSESYLKKLFRQLSAAFRYAQSENIINKNPMANIKRPKSQKITKKVYALTIDEQKRLVEVLSGVECDSKYSVIFRLMLLTGLRPGEVLALDKDKDINFNFSRITIRRTITRDLNDRACLGEVTKTENGMRTIVMSEACKSLLLEYLKTWEPNPLNLLFYDNANNHIYSTNQLNSAFKHIIQKYEVIHFEKVFAPLSEKRNPIRFKKYTFYKKESGEYKSLKDEPSDWIKHQSKYFYVKKIADKPFSPHMLRHTFATRCIESGMPVKVLSKLLGHSDIQITLNTYCDVFDKFENDAVKQAEKYMEKLTLIS